MKQSILLLFALSLSVMLSRAQLPNPALVGYWHNWNDVNAPYIPLNNIDTRYNVIAIAFAVPVSPTDMTMQFVPDVVSQTTLQTQIQNLKAQGKRVLLSIGGANAFIDLTTTANRNAFITSLTSLVMLYGFDGIDIDIEQGNSILNAGGTISSPSNVAQLNLIAAVKQIMANYRSVYPAKKLLLTMAPETAYVVGGQSAFGGIWGGYLPIIDALRDSLDLLQMQLYNSGTMFGINGNTYTQGTADFIVAMSEALIAGFNTSGGLFAGLPPSKIAVGLPACSLAAGGGYVSPAEMKAAIKYLRGSGPQPGSYTLSQSGGYPTLRGMMTWSINWDALSTCGGAYSYAIAFESLFNANSVPSYVSTYGLRGWWPFNGNANDLSGYGNNGTVINATGTTDRNNESNQAYYFNGSAQIDCGNNSSLNFNDCSFSVWINTGSLNNTYQTIIAKYDVNFLGSYALAINTNRINIWFTPTSGGDFNINSNTILSTNQWYHIVATHSATQGTRIYINGNLDISNSQSFNVLQAPNDRFRIGSQGDFFPVRMLNGKIDDVAVWNRAITQAEVLALYTGISACNGSNLQVSVQPTSSSCGLPNGTITSIQSGGTTPYVYQWNNGTTVPDQQNLNSGIYTITVNDSNGCSATGNGTISGSICPKVTSQTISNITQNTATVTWPSLSCASKYRIILKKVGPGTQTTILVSAPQTSHTLTGLEPNTTYQVRIRTQCSQNGSVVAQLSPISSFTTLNSQGILCLPPQNIANTNSTANATLITWASVSGVVQYHIRYRPVGTTGWLLLTVANPLATTALIEGLNAATTYEYQIRVKCSNDPVEFSPYSSLLTFTTSPFRLEYGSDESTQLIIYPNPATDVLYVSMESDQAPYEIINMLGQIESTGLVRRQIQVSGLSKGLHILAIIREGKKEYHRFIIE